MKRLRKAVAQLAMYLGDEARAGGFRVRPIFLTLTYAKPDDWDPRDISGMLTRLRAELRRQARQRGKAEPVMRVLWVAEIQPERLRRTGDAVVHYHLVLWVPQWAWLPKVDAAGFWAKGASKTERARNPVAYLAKYASKGGKGKFPKGARLFGYRGLRTSRIAWKAFMRPLWARQHARGFEPVRRVLGPPEVIRGGLWPPEYRGWWINLESGELFRSPWQLVDHAPDWSWVEFAESDAPWPEPPADLLSRAGLTCDRVAVLITNYYRYTPRSSFPL